MKYLTSSLYDFEKLIRGGYLYVDKTEYVWKMVQTPFEAFFFSRPRRFGKSLLVSTLKAVFEGKRELFQGLAIYDKPYDWKKYPVIHLDLGDCSAHTASDLREYLSLKLQSVARKHGVDTPILPTLLATSFSCLIEELSRSAPVVILIDEYDMPILQNLTRGKELVAIRDTLSDFYAALKTQQSNERFVFFDGSKQVLPCLPLLKAEFLGGYFKGRSFCDHAGIYPRGVCGEFCRIPCPDGGKAGVAS